MSWKDPHPRALLAALISKAPKASRAKLLKSFIEAVEDDDQMLSAVIRYAFDNAYLALKKKLASGSPLIAIREKVDEQEKAAAKGESKKQVEHYAKVITKNILALKLSSMLPNGRTLGETTFKECAEIGGIFNLISKQGKPSQLVGDVLSDAQLKEIVK